MNHKPQQKTAGFRRSGLYPVLYMFAVTFVFCAVLIGLAASTRERVENNQQIMFERATLMAVDPGFDAGAGSAAVHEAFVSRMAPPVDGSAGAYRVMVSGRVEAYALPFSGQGFWNVIRGVVGIAPDGRRLLGIAFFEQSETPGLGAEITRPYFLQQFEGLAVSLEGPPLALEGAGQELATGEVQAITGATQTCMRLERFLNEALRSWQTAMGLAAAAQAERGDG